MVSSDEDFRYQYLDGTFQRSLAKDQTSLVFDVETARTLSGTYLPSPIGSLSAFVYVSELMPCFIVASSGQYSKSESTWSHSTEIQRRSSFGFTETISMITGGKYNDQ
eukprot:IDg6758t1